MFALFRCLECGECCRHLVGKRFGAALTPQEKQRLEILASRRCVNARFEPLTTNGYVVTTWQFADEVCPFLEENRCKIYEWRPLLCKMYPLHPFGIGQCTMVEQAGKRGFQVVYPPQMQQAGREYVRKLVPLVKAGLKRYNLALGKWELNLPYQIKNPYVNVTL
jgi:Fe-S-cluster containining protein